MIFTYALCITVVILLLVYILICKYSSYDKYLKYFIELNNNITVITSDTEMLAMNQAGLDFFHFTTFKALHKRHKFLSKLFTEIDTEDKYVEGINWVTKIDKMQNIKVEMHHKHFKQIFYMQVSKIRPKRYQVSFYNISRMVAEKDAIVQIAEKDDLTQIYNRNKFNKVLSSALLKAEIYKEPFTIVLFDIDHFKKVNDEYGHNIGDQVLIQLVLLIKSQLRGQDTFARWGGEEFIILSKGATRNDSYALAERLRQSIETFPFDEVGHLTCSFGVSQYEKNDNAIVLLKRADDALYRSKNNGRNRVNM